MGEGGIHVGLAMATADVFEPAREPMYAATEKAITMAIEKAGHAETGRLPNLIITCGVFMILDDHMVAALTNYFGDRGCPPIIGGTSMQVNFT